MVRISEIELLKMLEKNARIPYTELAKHFKVSESAIRKKVKQLEKKGIIKKYETKIDYKKIGYKFDAIIGLDTTPEFFIHAIELLKKENNILQIWTSTGDHMIMFRAIFRNNEELSNFIKNLESIKGITKVCPAILLEEILD